MSVLMHTLDNKPINPYNFYKYLCSLYRINIIPDFKVEIDNKLNELKFIFKHTTITYFVDINQWTSTVSINNDMYNYPYLIENKMISCDNNYLILKSNNINDILEPTLGPFNQILDNIDPRNMYTNNKDKHIHNIDHSHYYMFINNLMRHEKKMQLDVLIQNMKPIPEELWDIINTYNKHSEIYYYDFLKQFV